jgi:hypothetical protein
VQLEEEELLARGREQHVLRIDAGHRDLVRAWVGGRVRVRVRVRAFGFGFGFGFG